MSLLATLHSYASEYVRSTTFLPSGEVAPPVTISEPALPSLFGVPVFFGVKSPTFFSGTGAPVALSAADGVYTPAGPVVLLVTKTGTPVPDITIARQS